jgi:hypothetical protein
MTTVTRLFLTSSRMKVGSLAGPWGYANTSAGFLDKISLLRGYTDLAREIKNFNLPVIDIDGVFMLKKIGAPQHPFHLKKASLHAHSMPNVKAATGAGSAVPDRGRTTSDSLNGSAQGSGRSPSPMKSGPSPTKDGNATNGNQYLDPTIPMSKRQFMPLLRRLPLAKVDADKPPPCNNYYLDSRRGCTSGENCRYGHHYILTQEQLRDLSANARKTPCPFVNKSACALSSFTQ